MIRVITFDFWGTLYADERVPLEQSRTGLRVERLGEYLKDTPHGFLVESIEEHFRNTCDMFRDLRDQGEIVHPKDMIRAMGDELGVEFSPTEIDDMTVIIEEAAIEVPPRTMPHAACTVRTLSRSYKLAIVSDTGLTPGHILKRIMAKDSLLDPFAGFAFSNETMHSKPHPEPFLQILDELNVQPEEAVHVGDLMETDVLGAKSVGMKAILLTENSSAAVDRCEADACIGDLRNLPAVVGRL